VLEGRGLFAERITTEQRRLFGYIVTLLPNFEDAEDAFQETCMRLWAKSEQYDPARDFLSWACGFAKNVACEVRKRNCRSHSALSERAMEDIAEVRFREKAGMEAWEAKFSDCLGRLPPAQRKLLARSYAGDETIDIIAGRINSTRAALYMKLMRIRRRLAECLGEPEGQP